MTPGDQAFDHRNHLGDMCGGARFHIRRQGVQRRHVGVKLIRGARGDFRNWNIFIAGAGVDLVIHIGDVARIDDMSRAIVQPQQPRTTYRTPPPGAHCRYAQNHKPSARIHTCARARDRSAQNPVSSASLNYKVSTPFQFHHSALRKQKYPPSDWPLAVLAMERENKNGAASLS